MFVSDSGTKNNHWMLSLDNKSGNIKTIPPIYVLVCPNQKYPMSKGLKKVYKIRSTLCKNGNTLLRRKIFKTFVTKCTTI